MGFDGLGAEKEEDPDGGTEDGCVEAEGAFGDHVHEGWDG